MNVEHASGKGSGDENFPVGSWLIAKRLRPHVMAFYRFARNADDVADSAELTAADKLDRLSRMAETLDGATGGDAPAAQAMRASLIETGIAPVHCHELLAAFRQDAVKSRYANWQELMEYCRLSAAPVGRYLLDLHGELPDIWPASDALCAALQVINHLQDCGKDYHELDRVYLPEDWLTADHSGVGELTSAHLTPGLRRSLDRAIAATRPLIAAARALPEGVKDRGLRTESAVIVGLADRLLTALSVQDPLAKRVKLSAVDFVTTLVAGVLRHRFGGAG